MDKLQYLRDGNTLALMSKKYRNVMNFNAGSDFNQHEVKKSGNQMSSSDYIQRKKMISMRRNYS